MSVFKIIFVFVFKVISVQANRAKAKATYDFGEGQQLPATIPDKFNEKLTNRIFKRRVIDMICNCILEHISPLPLKDDNASFSRKFILDYSSCPIQFTCPVPSSKNGILEFDKQPVFLTDLPPMGEADVKFLRWSHVFQGDLVAYSVDGDFIPISLIHHEKQLLVDKRQEPFRIALYRIRYKMPEEKVKKSQVAKIAAAGGGSKQLLLTGTKRRSDGSMVLSTSGAQSSSSSVVETAKSARHGREYEYVDIPTLYQGLCNAFDQRRVDIEETENVFFMRVLAVLIGLGGTDFSRCVLCIHVALFIGAAV